MSFNKIKALGKKCRLWKKRQNSTNGVMKNRYLTIIFFKFWSLFKDYFKLCIKIIRFDVVVFFNLLFYLRMLSFNEIKKGQF